MDVKLLDELYYGFQDHPRWCEECLTIPDKQARVVPLRLTPAQLKLHRLIKRQRERKRPVRIVTLKARRVHMSVGVATEIFHETPFNAGQHAMIVSHELKSTRELYSYYDHFQKSYQPYRGVVKLPGVRRNNRVDGIEWDNGSYIQIATAENVKTGRSFSLRHLHLSEFAFWRDAATLMTGLMSAVPDDPDTTVVVESTANGVGGPFYELCQQAMNPTEATEWVFLFFAWWEHPEYSMPLPMPADQFQRNLGKLERYGDEPAEKAKYNLTLEQLWWRRVQIDTKLQGSVEKFRQEYPGSPQEAFLTSGRPRFDHPSLGRMQIVQDTVRGGLEVQQNGTRTQVVFTPREFGELAIYRKPVAHRFYAIGADPASGIDIKEGTAGNSDPDWSVASVLDADTGEQVAKLRGRLEPAPFAQYLYDLGRYYNWAYLVPESNRNGLGVIQELLRLEYPLSHIYRREPRADNRVRGELHLIGFETNTITRPQLISGLDAAIREFAVLVRDPNTLQELLTFIVRPDGKPAGQQGCHDDEALALALGVVGLQSAPRVRPKPPGSPDRPRAAAASYGRRRLGTRERDD